jgi:prepilin-type N-terminal cleavage/methylation domain-containing protein
LHAGVRTDRPSAGFTLLELVAGMAVAAIATASVAAGAGALARRVELSASRRSLVSALLDARRQAYLSREAVEVAVHSGDRELRVRAGADEDVIPLDHSVYVARAPSSGHVRFFGSGLADNATVELAVPGSEAHASVVVNQRGMIR